MTHSLKAIKISAWLTLFMVAAIACSGAMPAHAQSEVNWPPMRMVERWSGFVKALGVTNAGDGSGRLFVVEQQGRIRVIRNGQVLQDPLLDLSDRVLCCNERGLLGLAFPPGFAQKQYFYVLYSDRSNANVIARFWISDQNPDRADPQSEQVVMAVQYSGGSHRGGQLAFGPDGYLYIGLGDGIFRELPGYSMNAQNPALLFGKILRIDTESSVAPPPRPLEAVAPGNSTDQRTFLPLIASSPLPPYRVPPTNPFVGRPGYRSEIWAMGLRNPWRFSFDRQTGDLIVGDVGQHNFEEVDFQAAGSQGGQNYGWPYMEGNHCYFSSTCDSSGLTAPVIEYRHAQTARCAIIGGPVYRGQAFVELRGISLFGDHCSGEIWGMQRVGGAWQSRVLSETSVVISSFGEDEAGDVFVTGYSSGKVYQISPEAE